MSDVHASIVVFTTVIFYDHTPTTVYIFITKYITYCYGNLNSLIVFVDHLFESGKTFFSVYIITVWNEVIAFVKNQ